MSEMTESTGLHLAGWYASCGTHWVSAEEATYGKAKAALTAHLVVRHPKQYALVPQVMAYATEHYNDGGWDVVAETMEPWDVVDAIGKATTLKGALAKLEGLVGVWADQEADAQFHATESYCGFQGEHAWCYFPPKHAEGTHSDGTPVGYRTPDGYPR